MIYVMLAQQFLFRVRQRFKKTPSLSLAEAKFLPQLALPRRSQTIENAIAILKYRNKRKQEAYRSHRKKRLVEAHE